MSIHHYSARLMLIGLFSLTACDTFKDNGPSRESVTGDYDTETLTVKTDTGTVDALAKGTYIEMKLAPGNEVKEGSLFVSPEFTEEDTEGSRRIGFAGHDQLTAQSHLITRRIPSFGTRSGTMIRARCEPALQR